MHSPSPSSPTITLVAALAENDVIGVGNELPWHLPADLAHFKSVTLDKPILMGRRTWESLPGLLPRRQHLVLSHNPDYQAKGCMVVSSLAEAIAAIGDVPELMIVGGASIYALALPYARRFLLTRVHVHIDGDTFFPEWDPREWQEEERIERAPDPRNPHAMTFQDLRRQPQPTTVMTSSH